MIQLGHVCNWEQGGGGGGGGGGGALPMSDFVPGSTRQLLRIRLEAWLKLCHRLASLRFPGTFMQLVMQAGRLQQ